MLSLYLDILKYNLRLRLLALYDQLYLFFSSCSIVENMVYFL